ncbi:hypothetical protein T484DRAFT_1781211 [Baffinella frigidus]|nr:hypothetical protein T484DRAFT_1781211 [Cryptophyta sp. CCMP2293]
MSFPWACPEYSQLLCFQQAGRNAPEASLRSPEAGRSEGFGPQAGRSDSGEPRALVGAPVQVAAGVEAKQRLYEEDLRRRGGAAPNAARLTTMFEVDAAMGAQILAEAQRAAALRAALPPAPPESNQAPPPPLRSPMILAQGHQQPEGAGGGGKKRGGNAARLTAIFNVDAATHGHQMAQQLQAAATSDPRMDAFMQALPRP